MAFGRRGRPDGTTPEEREARIAELRARRRRRMRMLAVRGALGFAALVVLVVAGGFWLLGTLGGRDFLLAQVTARLPAGTTLEWARAEGPASGPLTMYDVRYVQRGCPDRDGEPVAFGQCDVPTVLTFTAARVHVDPALRPLLGRRLRLDALDIDRAALDLPVAADAPFELPRWPESLPRIDLPLALQADTIRVDGLRVTRAGESLIDIRSLQGGLDARQGDLHVERLVVDSDRGRFSVHGDYAPDDDYRTDLTASALLPAPAGRTRPRIGLVARGDLQSMDVALSGHAPDRTRANLTLRGSRWTLSADSRGLDPALLSGGGTAGTPATFTLGADGEGGRAALRGEFTQGTLHAVLQPSQVRIEEQVLALSPLRLDLLGGSIVANGHADFSVPEDATFKLAVNVRDLAFGGGGDAADPAPEVGVEADFGLAGRTAAWAAIGKATLRREGLQATVDLDGRGNAQRLELKTLRAAMPTGTLEATGSVGWAPALDWRIDAALAGFDPGYFAPGWRGAVDGSLASTGGTRDDGGLDIEATVSSLGGNLRGRRLGGQAHVLVNAPADGQTRTDAAGELALTLGGSRVDAKGALGERIEVDARLAPLQLDDVLPGAAGVLRGTLRLRGPRDAPDVEADLEGSGLGYGDYRVASLRAEGRLPWRGGSGALTVAAQGVDAGMALDEVRIAAQGAVERLQLQADARGAPGVLSLSGSAERHANGWRGALDALDLAPAKGASWALQSPARYAQDGARWTLSRSCFAGSDGGSLCAEADWPRRGLSAEGQGLPLALLSPYLPPRDDGRPWLLRGELALDAQLRPAGNAWQGHVDIASAEGGMRSSERARSDAIGYRDLALRADISPARIEATLGTVFNGSGRIDARIATGWDAYSPLAGEIAVDIDELAWVELFSPDIVEPSGRLEGRVTLAGTRSQPMLGGQARLSGFTTELPSLAIALEDGDVRLEAQPDGSARIEGSVRSGEGLLRVAGALDWRGGDMPLVLELGGENVLLSDTRDLRLVAAPEITVRYAARQPLNVAGKVTVSSAMMDLERLDDGVSTSPDVVVLDPVDPERGEPLRLQMDLTLAMGEDVRMRGFGLDGTLGGSLRVRAVPGREMTGSGTLEVGGRYKAYGQELRITRGRLAFSGPVSDPILDIRAERRIDAEDITAGIDVTGRASAPQASVWTDPAKDSSEALSYLALGRSVSSLSSTEGRQLDAAAAALTAGGSMLAGQLGSSIGLDDAGVMHSRALGGSVLGIGKQISPRVYIGFGVSLLGTGQVLTLKYLLRRGFDVEIESSTLESRGSINWRHESD